MKLTIFYDGNCPLCTAEMNMLRGYDHNQHLCLENIYSENFQQRYPLIDVSAADKILHGLDENGKLLFGLDVTARAWQLVGKKRWISLLRWPVIRWVADAIYLLFARHRMRISSLLMGNQICRLEKQSQSKKNCARNINEDEEF